MSRIIDVTGIIKNGMWSFGSLFPKFEIIQRSGVNPGFGEYHYTEFQGMHSQVGTYLETPAHFLGMENSFLVDDIPLEKLVDVGCVVLKCPRDTSDLSKKEAVTKEDLLSCPNFDEIQPGDCIAVYFGWDKYWMNDDVFYPCSPYFTYDAMQLIISKNPSILATDTPAWDNYDDPSDFFPDFYAANILMLAPLYNLDEVKKPRVRISVLPLRFDNVSASSCRAFNTED